MLFCRDFQTGKCSHTKDHYSTICNERKWLQHICAQCWTSSRTIARHSEFSVECRGSSPSSSSSFDPPATTSTWLSSDKDGVFSIDVVSPASHDSRLCKIFSPVAGAGSCSYVDSSTMDSRGFPDMPDISISPDSSLSEDISRPFPTFSPMVADFSSCIDSCPFQPFLDLHACVSESRVYNFQGLRLPVSSSLRLAVLFTRLRGLCRLWFFRIWLARWIRLFLFFSRHLIFVITRVPLIFWTQLTVTCYQRLWETRLLVHFLTIPFHVQLRSLLWTLYQSQIPPSVELFWTLVGQLVLQ